MRTNLIILLRILSTFAIATTALIYPLRFVSNLKFEFTLISTVVISTIFIMDFAFNITEYLRRKESQSKSTILEHPQTIPLLAIDFIALLPFGLLENFGIFGLLPLLKIIRIASYQATWNKQVVRYMSQLKLLFFVFWITILTHWLACGWLYIHSYETATTTITQYLKSLYWTVVTLTTVGYGDIVPKSDLEIVYSLIVMVFGVGVYGYVIGNIANMLSGKDPAKIAFQQNIEQLRSFVQNRDLPLHLQQKIRNYYAYLWEKKMGYDESTFLNNLPHSLREEVSLHLKRKMLDTIPLFKNMGDAFLNDICVTLKTEIYTPGDMIISQGDEGHIMYLIIKGKVDVFKNETPEEKFVLDEGSFVGEISLLYDAPRMANVQAATYVLTYQLERTYFNKVVEDHPDITDKIKQIAKDRLAETNH